MRRSKSSSIYDPFAIRPLWAVLLLVVPSLLSARPLAAQAVEPDWTQYNLKFPPPPADGASAAASVSQRAAIWIEHAACGEEDSFLEVTLKGLGTSANDGGNKPNPEQFWGDGYLGIVMAKLQWLKLGHTNCNSTHNVLGDFYDTKDFPDEPRMEARMATTFGADCRGQTEGVFQPAPPSQPFKTVISKISGACLKAQINFVLNQVQEGDAFPGSQGLPCNIVGTFKGDWDARMKTLIRILFLDSDKAGGPGGGSVLTFVRPDGRTTRQYIQEDLITVDGGPAPDSYSWTACGDNEKDTGSPQDREDENSGWSDFWDSVGDALTWLCRRLILIVVFLSVVGLIAALGGLIGLGTGAFAAVGVAAILAGQIPETENHRLMIESTRFLNNQLIIQALGPGNASGISGDQSHVKDWLLNKFQDVAKNDFVEYNARPYQEYSLSAIRNLADFSTDADVRNGAQMLLEYSAAKFAVGSNQGRRLVPFRRRLPAVSCILGEACEECYIHPGCHTPPLPLHPDEWHPWFEIFHPKAYADQEVSLALLFNGQTQQLRNRMVAADMIDVPAATSGFVINPLIADLAISKSVAYLQRIHHAGYEIYSSSASALITAGGIEADHANHFTLGVPISTPTDPTQDIGGGLPTTVMFTGKSEGVTDLGQSKMMIGNFISFRGNLKKEGNDESFTDNLCVWRNFACGINLQVPADIAQCLVPSSNQLVPHWFFFDSSNSSPCNGYAKGPKFFLVMYIVCPSDQCSGVPPNSAGFIEVVDNPSDPFDVFQAKVLFKNPHNPNGDLGKLGQGCLSNGDCTGRYHTFLGDDLDLELRGHQDDSEKTGITAVNNVPEKDLDEWDFAAGDIMNSTGDGVITIINPRLGTQLILDFSNVSHPCRRVGSNQPCTQQ